MPITLEFQPAPEVGPAEYFQYTRLRGYGQRWIYSACLRCGTLKDDLGRVLWGPDGKPVFPYPYGGGLSTGRILGRYSSPSAEQINGWELRHADYHERTDARNAERATRLHTVAWLSAERRWQMSSAERELVWASI